MRRLTGLKDKHTLKAAEGAYSISDVVFQFHDGGTILESVRGCVHCSTRLNPIYSLNLWWRADGQTRINTTLNVSSLL